MSHSLMCPCLPSDSSDPESLTALAERYLVWSEMHNVAATNNTNILWEPAWAGNIVWLRKQIETAGRSAEKSSPLDNCLE